MTPGATAGLVLVMVVVGVGAGSAATAFSSFERGEGVPARARARRLSSARIAAAKAGSLRDVTIFFFSSGPAGDSFFFASTGPAGSCFSSFSSGRCFFLEPSGGGGELSPHCSGARGRGPDDSGFRMLKGIGAFRRMGADMVMVMMMMIWIDSDSDSDSGSESWEVQEAM